EWLVVWARHAQSIGAVVPPPVDFSREMVVGVFMGERDTGGYQIEIIEVERTASVLRVLYVTREPEAGAILTQALTQPFHLVRLARDDAFVSFVRESGARRGRTERMKITRVETIVLNLPTLIDGAPPMLRRRARPRIDMLLLRVDSGGGGPE